MLKNILTTTLILISASAFISSAKAEETPGPVVVNVSSCGKLAGKTEPFILVLNNGDDLLESISQCAKAAKLPGASISGLGQVHNPALAYFTNNPHDKPTVTTFPGYYELASINGNIAANGNNYYTHAHASLADKQFHGITGHVNKAEVGLTAEITIIPFSAPVQRTVDANTGFGPLVVG